MWSTLSVHNSGDAMFGLRVDVLAGVLEALPSTRVALEIDTDGQDLHITELKYLCPVYAPSFPASMTSYFD